MLGGYDLMDTAAEGACKAIIAHPHLQQHIDEVIKINNIL